MWDIAKKFIVDEVKYFFPSRYLLPDEWGGGETSRRKRKMWRKMRGRETQYDALKNLDRFLKFIVSSKLLDTHNIFFLGSLVSKDGRSYISWILMPSPSHCRVMSQDPSSRSRYPPTWGGFDPGPPSSQFWKRERYRWATGEGLYS